MHNVLSFVMALSVALDDPWWCFPVSLTVMASSAHAFLTLARGLLEGLLIVEGILCRYLPRSNSVEKEIARTSQGL